MKNFFKGATVTAVVLIILLIINVFCNRNDINSDSTALGTVSAVCAMLFYSGLTKRDKTRTEIDL